VEPEPVEPLEEVASAEPPSPEQGSSRRSLVFRDWLRRTFGSDSGQEPVAPETEGQVPTLETPSPFAPPAVQEREMESAQDRPPRDTGFQQGIVVQADYEDPIGPRIVGELTLSNFRPKRSALSPQESGSPFTSG
jgi:hypothetical protein